MVRCGALSERTKTALVKGFVMALLAVAGGCSSGGNNTTGAGGTGRSGAGGSGSGGVSGGGGTGAGGAAGGGNAVSKGSGGSSGTAGNGATTGIGGSGDAGGGGVTGGGGVGGTVPKQLVNVLSAPDAGPITSGPDGNLWFTEFLNSKIGCITLSGALTEFPVTEGSGLGGITSGPDGNLWFTETESNKIGRITTNGTITEFPIPIPTGYYGGLGTSPGWIVSGPDGNLWFTETALGFIGRITTSGVITEFPLSAPSVFVTAQSGGNVWFAEGTSITKWAIGSITTSGVTTEFPIVTTNEITGLTMGSDGNLWFTVSDDFDAVNNVAIDYGTVGRMTTAGVFTLFPLAAHSGSLGNGPQNITAGPDGNLWFVETVSAIVGHITPLGTISEFQVEEEINGLTIPLSILSTNSDITVGPGGKALYFTGITGGIGYVTP
jgi:streptogramin lyase